MPRGGYRKGAGRKPEYLEPVQKILIGLPVSVLEKLDQYAEQNNLSRPKAIARLLEEVMEAEKPKPAPEKVKRAQLLEELKALKKTLK